MRRQRGRHEREPKASRSPARRVGRVALFAVPAAVIAILAMNVIGTRSQFEAAITNPNNHAETAPRVELSEGPAGECTASNDGTIHTCDVINKFGGGTLTPGVPVTETVDLQNTGALPADLFVRPSACSDTLTGAGGVLCNEVTVQVTCGTTVVIAAPGVTLNQFHANRATPPAGGPNGYAAGTLAPGERTTCDFTLTAIAPISEQGTVSQPIAMILMAVSP